MRLLSATILLATLSACSNTSISGLDFARPASIPAAIGDLTEHPEQVTIYALDPESIQMKGLTMDAAARLSAEQAFYDHQILASADLPGTDERHELITLLWGGISDHEEGIPIDCFNPRHGIRVRSGDRWLDWVICFKCHRLHVYDQDGEQVASKGISSSVEPRFSAIYRAAGLELAD
jgi:hypothetical protein